MLLMVSTHHTHTQIIGRHHVIKLFSLMDGIIPRVYYLVCSHELERDEWLLALQNNIIIVNNGRRPGPGFSVNAIGKPSQLRRRRRKRSLLTPSEHHQMKKMKIK
jgi:hypothetical protein